MVKLTLQCEGPPDHHEGYPAKLPHTCNSVEGETQRAVVQSKQSLPLGLQSRHTTGIEEGEQESQSPPAMAHETRRQ